MSFAVDYCGELVVGYVIVINKDMDSNGLYSVYLSKI